MLGHIFFYSNDNHSWAELGNSEIRSIQQPPVCCISHFFKLALEMAAVIFKHRIQETPDVFQHHCTGPAFVHQTQSLGEQIPFIVFAKLLSGYGKRRAGYTSCQKINAFKGAAIELF